MVQTVIVTGSSRGIGLSVAKFLLGKGANVVSLSRTTTDELTELAKKYPSTLSLIPGDICNDEHQAKAVDTAISKYGSLDGVVLNAAQVNPLDPIEHINIDDIRKHFEVNYFSCIKLVQLCIPHLRKSAEARVVFVSSQASQLTIGGWLPYVTSKSSINGLCSILAKEEKSITAVSIAPGAVDTPMQPLIREIGGRVKDEIHDAFVALTDNNQLIHPDQPGKVLANLVLSADKDISGSYFEFNDEKLSKYH